MDDYYFMEHRAFSEFLREPLSDHTLSLLRFAIKPFLTRIAFYTRIPPEKWTPQVCSIVSDTVLHSDRDAIFLPLIEPVASVVETVANKNTAKLSSMFAYLCKQQTYDKLSETERAVRNTILNTYIVKKKIKSSFCCMTDHHKQLVRANKHKKRKAYFTRKKNK